MSELKELWDDCNMDDVQNSIDNHFINFHRELPSHSFSYYVKEYGLDDVQGFEIVPTLDDMIERGDKKAIKMDFRAFRQAVEWCIDMDNIMDND